MYSEKEMYREFSLVNVEFKVDVKHAGREIWWLVKSRNQDPERKVKSREQDQGMQMFSGKGQRVNISGFVQLCCCSTKTAINNS